MEQTVEKAGKIRKVIARHMTESAQVPTVAYTVTLDATALIGLRKVMNDELAGSSVKISYNAIIMKACAAALMEHPYVNAYFDGESITLNLGCNIGLAVETQAGLMVPNVKEVQSLDVYAVNRALAEAVRRTQNGAASYDDMTGGTFTITNQGGMGIEHATPLLNPPETAILGVYAIKDTPVAVQGQVLVRPVLTLVLVADHRLVDGALAARFLTRVKEQLENGKLE